MWELSVGPDYAAALVVEGTGISVVQKPIPLPIEYREGRESVAQ
jgi:hypothetical protein